MSVNEKLKDAEAGSYGSIAPEPENDAVAYVKRHTIALGALSVLAFGAAAVALVTGPPPLALASGGYLVGGMLMKSTPAARASKSRAEATWVTRYQSTATTTTPTSSWTSIKTTGPASGTRSARP